MEEIFIALCIEVLHIKYLILMRTSLSQKYNIIWTIFPLNKEEKTYFENQVLSNCIDIIKINNNCFVNLKLLTCLFVSASNAKGCERNRSSLL